MFRYFQLAFRNIRQWKRNPQTLETIKKMTSFTETPAKASICCEDLEDPPHTFAMYEALKDCCQNNAKYFQKDSSDNGQRLYQGFMAIIDNIDSVWPLVDNIRKVAPQYDFDESSPGNGYRSFVSVVDSCVLHGLKISRQVCTSRDALLFRKGYFTREVESCGQLLASLGTCLHHLHTLLSWAEQGELFPTNFHTPEELFAQADVINQYCFYGRCLGFQFIPSMRGILKGISICMAGFSEAYYSQGNLISSVWTGGQYLLDPELRARRIVNISQSADVEFCKAFWFLAESEIMKRVPSLMSSTVAVNKLMSLPPVPLEVTTNQGTLITVEPSTVHIGLKHLNVRLISVNKRCGMRGDTSSNTPPSDGVLFHCHGGGFVAQSSKSHEMYLRNWAAKLNVPIVSIDYSLAPQAPFPRALEEVFYAYCWLLNNFKVVGTTGKRIVFAGDSAGANLLAGCVLKILQNDLRLPTGVFMAYAPLLVSFIPSPARLLCLMDPLLPFGFMMRCLKAYACPPKTDEEEAEKENTEEVQFEGVKFEDVKFIDDNSEEIKPEEEKTEGEKSEDEKTDAKEQDLMMTSLTPGDSNGFLKISPSQDGPSAGLSSFEEVSPTDMVELQAHKSGSERRKSSDTTISAESLQSENTQTAVSPLEDKSHKYVSQFLENYVLESDTDSEGMRIRMFKPVAKESSSSTGAKEFPSIGSNGAKASSINGDIQSENPSSLVDEPPLVQEDNRTLKTRLTEAASGMLGVMSSRIAYLTGSHSVRPKNSAIKQGKSKLDALILRSPSDEFVFSVPRDPLLSPYWAEDELLKKFPPVQMLTVHLDPCLDDCVMFAKKLKRLGNVIDLEVLEGLPHGFLNFSLMSKEANEGSKLCVQRIQELFNEERAKPRSSNNIGDL